MLAALRSQAYRAVNAVLAGAGVRLERTTRFRSLNDFLASRKVDLVLDVGANQGQFGLSLREQGYAGRIWSFEPLSGAYGVLSRTASGRQPWQAFNTGLSDHEGQAEINVSRYSVFSSLNTIKDAATAFDPSSSVIGRETISLSTVDLAMAGQNGARTFLKIDTQGHERSVLGGAQASLHGLVGVQMELPIQHLYEGVWHLEEAIAFMRANGFVISNIAPTNFDAPRDPVSLLEVDCIFKNERLERLG